MILTRFKQKIIPDGFTEIIFHFGDHYRINLDGTWKKQGNRLLAGQISKFFYLENSGSHEYSRDQTEAPGHDTSFWRGHESIVDKVVALKKSIDIDHGMLTSSLIKFVKIIRQIIQSITQWISSFQKKEWPLWPRSVRKLRSANVIFRRCFKSMLTYTEVLREDHSLQLHLPVDQRKQSRLGSCCLRSRLLRSVAFYQELQSIHRGRPERVYFCRKKNLANFFLKKWCCAGLYNTAARAYSFFEQKRENEKSIFYGNDVHCRELILPNNRYQ